MEQEGGEEETWSRWINKEDRELTVTWYSGEGDVHLYSQFLSTTLVDRDRGINVDSSIVKELHSRE